MPRENRPRWLPIIALTALMMLCASCATPGSSSRACPPLPAWSQAEALALADDLEQANRLGLKMVVRAVMEYRLLRKQRRAE